MKICRAFPLSNFRGLIDVDEHRILSLPVEFSDI